MSGGLGSFGFGTGPEFDVAFEVVAALSLSDVLVRVDFSAALDSTHSANFSPVNYTIDGLEVLGVGPAGSHSALLTTSPQESEVLYEVVVNSTPGRIMALTADFLDPDHATASFEGAPVRAAFIAAAQSSRKVRLQFNETMSESAFADAANFQLHRIDGTVVPIEAVNQTGPDNTRAELTLGASLVGMEYYSVRVGAQALSEAGNVVYPDTALFRWKQALARPVRLSASRFSGEVSGGLLGTPAGQVFISPAYGASVGNSVLQVDRVSVCTTAYDEYRPPPEPPHHAATFLGPGTQPLQLEPLVLWGPAHRIGDAVMTLADLREDTTPAPVDGTPEGLLVEPIDITRASFLNDGRWRLFPGTGASLGVFRTADNATPIGPGPTTGPFTIA